MVLWCNALRRIVGTTNEVTMALMVALWDADHGEGFTVQPVAGGYGMARNFELVTTEGRTTFEDASLTSQLANIHQKRTLSGLVNLANFIRYKTPVPENYPPLQQFDILVSQLDAKVRFILSDGTLAAGLPSLPASGQTIAIDLKTKPTRFKQIFE